MQTENIILAETYHREFNSSISPDYEKILYAKEFYPYIMNADGTNSYKLNNNEIGYMNPYYKESYFLNNYKILLTLEKQIN